LGKFELAGLIEIMGIYDREYYRREGPSILGQFVEGGKVCKWLIGINILCFILQLVTLQSREVLDLSSRSVVQVHTSPFTDALILDVNLVLKGQVWRLLTYAFLHSTGSIWHIVFNMLFLWWFGRQVESIYGHREFLAMYLVSAVLAGVVYVLAVLAGVHTGRALGASGAVTAVLVLCALHFPRQVIYLFFILPVPIWAFVVFVVAWDTYAMLAKVEQGVAAAAHLGGAAFAYAYYKMQWRITNWWPSLKDWNRQRRRPRLRIHREEDEPSPVGITTAPRSAADEHLEAQMDAILEKISRVGQEGLTEKEKEFLLRASETLRKRRN
jgi:membrane associated rhomboid family serine protease